MIAPIRLKKKRKKNKWKNIILFYDVIKGNTEQLDIHSITFIYIK